MASLKFIADANIQTVTLGSAYTAASGTMSLTAGHGARLPSSGDFWLGYKISAGQYRFFKVTARTTDTLTVVANATEGAGDGNISSGETLFWAFTVAALTQLKADVKSESALVLLKTQTASSSSSLDFTLREDGSAIIQSDFDVYEIVFVGIVPATNGANLNMQTSADGGSSYDTGSNYYWSSYVTTGSGAGANGGINQTAISIGISLSNSTSTVSMVGTIRLYNPNSGVLYPVVNGVIHSMTSAGFALGNLGFWQCYGGHQSVTAINAFKFLMSSGNIASGTIRVYGVAKS